MNLYREIDDEELIRRLRHGEEEIEEYLLMKYKGLVLKKAQPLFLIGGENEDLIQEGMIGLFKAIRDYREDKNCSFYSFAGLCISRQMYTAIEKSGRKKNVPLNNYVSFYENSEESDQVPLMEVLEALDDVNPEKQVIFKEDIARLKERIDRELSDLEKEVLVLAMQNLDNMQIAEILGKNAKAIDNAKQRIRGKLKE